MAYIAIDIGGSLIKAGILTSEGVFIDRMTRETPKEDYNSLLEVLVTLVEWAKASAEIQGIALSQPCVTDEQTALALSEGALVYIKGQNPAMDLGKRFSLPYSGENDGNCAALAEVWLGSAKDVSDMAFVVCGTGIGGALVKDRRVHSGNRKFAGEFGMMILETDRETNQPVMWSEIGSTHALVRQYAKQMGVSEDSVNGRIVFERAQAGDAVAAACIREFYRAFALGLHNLQHVYDPQVILIGGGISTREEIVDEINCELVKLQESFTLSTCMPLVRTTTFLADGNLIGAVYHHIASNSSTS